MVSEEAEKVYQEAILYVLKEKQQLTESEYEVCLKLLFERKAAMKQKGED